MDGGICGVNIYLNLSLRIIVKIPLTCAWKYCIGKTFRGQIFDLVSATVSTVIENE